jgi:NADPH oxidase 2
MKLKSFIPFDKNITFHINIAFAIIFWGFVHTVAHFYNYRSVEVYIGRKYITAESLNFLSGPGISMYFFMSGINNLNNERILSYTIAGQFVTVSLFLIATSAVEAVRRRTFEIFWFTHHLFIVFFGGLLLHGSFCFIKVCLYCF